MGSTPTLSSSPFRVKKAERMNKTDSFHNSPSPTNPSETLGQSETRVENTITDYVASGVEPWSPKVEATLTEADDLVKVDPAEGLDIADAIDSGGDNLETNLMTLLEGGDDNEGDDFPITA